jgi:hypothetical protein
VFGLLRPKSSKKRSVLARQRISSAASRGKTNGAAWSFPAKGLMLLLLVFGAWALSIRLLDKISEISSYAMSVLVVPPKQWRIEMIDSNGTPLPEEIRRDVYKLAAKGLKTGTPSELLSLAKRINTLGVLESVRVIRPVIDTLILTAKLRRPVLLIDVAGRTQFLTADGTVFGDANHSPPNPHFILPSVRLTGIFDETRKPQSDQSNQIITTSSEREYLMDALDIWRLVSENDIPIKQLDFQKFRGYTLTLKDDTEIIIGIKPFEYKLKKLNDILAGLARDGVIASRIELDYEGKAFIKERKL